MMLEFGLVHHWIGYEVTDSLDSIGYEVTL
jgi:hypothetical protein